MKTPKFSLAVKAAPSRFTAKERERRMSPERTHFDSGLPEYCRLGRDGRAAVFVCEDSYRLAAKVWPRGFTLPKA
jgi:hypothetical protein